MADDASIPLRTLLAVRELASGEVLAIPVGDPERASFGDEETTLLEQRAFLQSFLAASQPETVARFALPPGTRLAVTDVVIPRRDVPRSALEVPIAIPSVVIPAFVPSGHADKGEAWVLVLPLLHTFYLSAGEDLDEAVAGEVKRLAAARALGPREHLALFPGRAERLVPVELLLDRSPTGPGGRAAKLRKAVADAEKRKAAIAVLESVATPMHEVWADDREIGRPLVAREAELARLDGLLSTKSRLSVVLVGAPRVGKTALLRAAWEAGRARGEPRLVFATSGAQLIAGMSGLGQWQERLRRVMDAAEWLDAIVYLDDLGDLFAERGSNGVDLAAGLKPWLEDGRVRLVAELDADRADWAEARSPGFFATVSRITLAPLSRVQSAAAVHAHVAFDDRRYPDVATLALDATTALVDLADRYLPYQAFPGKAVGLYREIVTARARRASEDTPRKIDAGELFEAFSMRTGVPVFLLDQSVPLLVEDVRAFLGKRLVGQDDAIARVAELVTIVKARLAPAGKPLATLLFVGPTGVGKTELARSLAEYLFGSPERLLRLDMSEYADGHAGERLFRGTDREDGYLTRKVREQPFAVVLLDEIEKAHPSVFDLLLQVCGEGRLTDARGRTAYFHNTILVLTSNLGARHGVSSLGFGSETRVAPDRHVAAVTETFRPELVNRFDRIALFRSLSQAEARAVLSLSLDKARARRGLLERGISLSVSHGALERLAGDGFSPAYGARAVRRHVEKAVLSPMSRLLAGLGGAARETRVRVALSSEPESLESGELVVARDEVGGLSFVVTRRTGPAALRDASGMEAIGAVRRDMQEMLALDPVESLRERVRFLVVQLGHDSKDKKKRPGGGAELAELMTEHHRLSTLETELLRRYDDARAVEELAMGALFEGEPLTPLYEEAERASTLFRRTLVRALVAEERARDSVTLLVSELYGTPCFDFWLLPLLENAKARGWTVELRIDGEAPPGSPPTRRWSNLRPEDSVRTRLATKSLRPHNLLVHVRGDHAGVLLGLEAGLHRFDGLSVEHPEAYMMVRRVALRATLNDAELADPRLVPLGSAAATELRKLPPVRGYDDREGYLRIVDRDVGLDLVHDEYWDRIEEIALEHLLLGLRDPRHDRSHSLTCLLDGEQEEPDDE